MRLFVGTFLESEQSANLIKMREALKPHLSGGRFVDCQNFHFTWLFLGEVAESEIDGIKKDLQQIALYNSCFSTSFCGMESFSGKTTVAMLRNTKPFAMLSSQVLDNLGHLAAVPPSKFRPHVTLIRKADYSLPFAEAKKSVMIFNRPFDVKNISLIESSLIKGVLKYIPHATFNLKEE